MGVDLRNDGGETIKLTNRHWAVMLTLAETFGWQPAGTLAPKEWHGPGEWAGRYDSSDGQFVLEEDAKSLARHLHGAVVSDQFELALNDVIQYLEKSVEASGRKIPDAMRMKPGEFSNIFSPLLMFLYEGSFYIE